MNSNDDDFDDTLKPTLPVINRSEGIFSRFTRLFKKNHIVHQDKMVDEDTAYFNELTK